jgi:hypothetical protein
MGIGMVLIAWAIAGSIFAGLGALVLGSAASFFTRGSCERRRKVIISAILFPFACLAWMGAVFVFQAVVNDSFLHRDLGAGDTWRCPLPDGYALMMIDVTDQGWVYNPKTQPGDDVGEQADAVAEVRKRQVAGPYILGSLGLENSGRVDAFFLMDTRAGTHKTFSNYAELRTAAQILGIQLGLEPIDAVYSRYRFTWFDDLAGVLLFVPPLVAGGFLVWWVIRLPRTRNVVY